MKDNITLLLLLLPFQIIAGLILLTVVNMSPVIFCVVLTLTILGTGLFAILLVFIGQLVGTNFRG